MPAIPPNRRTLLLESAVSVLAENGMRGLTHRAVDRQAGLVEGSCSAYLRTRKALQLALATYVVEQLGAGVEAVMARTADQPHDSPEAARELVALFQAWLSDSRLPLARLELTLEATRDPELAELLAHGRERLVEAACTSLDAKDHAGVQRTRTLVAALDGLLLSALLLGRKERSAHLDDGVRLLLGIVAEQ